MKRILLAGLSLVVFAHAASAENRYYIRKLFCVDGPSCTTSGNPVQPPDPPAGGLSLSVSSPQTVAVGGTAFVDVGLSGEGLEGVSLSFTSSDEAITRAADISLTGGTPALRRLDIPMQAGASGSTTITVRATHTDGRTASTTFVLSTFTAITATFSYTGSEQDYVVPGGVSRIRIDMWGAAGGGYSACNMYGCYYGTGGGGGYSDGEMAVTAGETIKVVVGGGGRVGANSAGWPNGTTGTTWSTSGAYTTTHASGGGGGMSAIKRGAALLMAAGAGGGAPNNTTAGGGGGFSGGGTNGATQTANGANPGGDSGGGYFIGGVAGGGSAYIGGVSQALTIASTSHLVADTSSADYPGGGIGTGVTANVGGNGFVAITPIASPSSNSAPVIAVREGINFAAESHRKDVYFTITDDYTSYDDLSVTVQSVDEDVMPTSALSIVRRGSTPTDNFIVRFSTDRCINFVPVRVTATDEGGRSTTATFDAAFFQDVGSELACSIGSATSRARVDMWGAAGGGFSACNMYGCWYGTGGGGGYAGGVMSVTGGESLLLDVGTGGGVGAGTAGWPNATSGAYWTTSGAYTTNYYSGGGGGMTAVKRGGSLLMAAGGGGGAPNNAAAGGGGGLTGSGANGATQTANGGSFGANGGGGYFIGGAGGGGSAYIGGVSGGETVAATTTAAAAADRATFPGSVAAGGSNVTGQNGFLLMKKVEIPTSNTAPVITVAAGTNFAGESHLRDIYFTIADDNTSAYDMNVAVVSDNTALIPSADFSIARRGGTTGNFILRVNTAGCINKGSVTVTATDEGGLSASETFDAAWFFTPGAETSCTVPAGVLSLRVALWGAAGGGFSSCSMYGCYYGTGGGGGHSEADLPVTGGETLKVSVGTGGGVGVGTAGWPNATAGAYWTTSTTYTTTYYSGSGGGMSAIKRGTTLLMAAGGGGGAGNNSVGGGGGGLTGGGANGATQTADGSSPGAGGGGGYFIGGSYSGGSAFVGTLANAATTQATGAASAGASASGYPAGQGLGTGASSAVGGSGFVLITAN